MYFLNKKEVDQSIAGMAEKFNFHGFFAQAEALQKVYEKYVTNNLPKADLINRLNIVKLLLCLSDTPTAKFLENPEEFEITCDVEEEDIDWKEFLNEGIERWAVTYDEVTSEEVSILIIKSLLLQLVFIDLKKVNSFNVTLKIIRFGWYVSLS